MGKRASFVHRRFRSIRLLGKGGMGRVFLAADRLENDRPVALKVFAKPYREGLLRHEFSTLRELRHPGIARALHFGVNEADGSPFFTMEYIRGAPLDAYVARLRGRGEAGWLATGLDLFRQVTEALAYLHRQQILHLDVKPENILVVELGHGAPPQTILIDFGLVRLPGDPRVPVKQGTAPYVAPELFRGETPGPAYDVYSLGVTFYAALSGGPPFRCRSVAGYSAAHLRSIPPPPEGLPAPLRDLVLRMLAKTPELRFADAGEVARELDALRLPGLNPPLPRAVFHEPVFVGRDREQERFKEWLREDADERAMLVVEGASGTGKTRLLEKLETILELDGRPVLRASGREEGGSLLRAIVRRAGLLFPIRGKRSDDESLLLAATGDLRPSPRLKRLLERSAPEELRAATLRLAARRLLRLLRENGVFLLVDDLHAADSLGQDLMIELGSRKEAAAPGAGAEPAAAGGVVATLVSSAAPALKEKLSRMASAPLLLELPPLSAEETSRLEIAGLDERATGLSPGQLAAIRKKLHEQTGGHPFFFIRGLLGLREGGVPLGSEDLEERAREELKSLDDELRRVLFLLTLLGRPSTRDELSSFLDLSPGRLDRTLRHLRQLGFLAASEHASRIVHESVAKAVRSIMSRDEETSMHLRIAERLADSASQRAEAAHHFFLGGRDREGIAAALEILDTLRGGAWSGDGRTTSALTRGASAAGESSRTGLRFLEAAGDLLEIEGRYAECLDLRSRVARLSGLVSAPPGPRSAAPAAAAPTRGFSLRTLRKLASALHRSGRIEEAQGLLDRCLREFRKGADPVELLHVYVEKALLCHFCQKSAEALELARAGLTRWRKLGREKQQLFLQPALNLHAIVGQIYLRRFDSSEALRWLKEGVDLAKSSISPTNTAVLLNNLGLACHMAQRFRRALAVFERSESAALDAGDGGALVTIYCNKAQIFAKIGQFISAREALSKVEELEQLDQSARLELSYRLTRALVQNLRGRHDTQDWEEVEELARQVNDSFFVHLSRLYRAEGWIEDGSLSKALEALEGKGWPALLEGARVARRACAEAVAGDARAARSLRRRYRKLSKGDSRMLAEWNRVYLGASALECGDLDEARSELGQAEAVFRSTSFASGRLEAALQLADLCLRERKEGEARRWIRTARKLSVDKTEGFSPRLRAARTSLLEARALLLRWPQGGRAERLAASLQDHLARAAGESFIDDRPALRIALEMLRAAQLLLRGDPEAARRLAIETRLRRRRLALDLPPARRAAFRRRDPWEALGLAAFRPPSGRIRLRPADGVFVATLVEKLSRSDSPLEAVSEALRDLASALGARRASLETRNDGRGGDKTLALARWPPRAQKPDWRGYQVAAPVLQAGRPRGSLSLHFAGSKAPTGSDYALIHACAQALAPHCLGAGALAAEAGAKPAPPGLRDSRSDAATQPLERTRALQPLTHTLPLSGDDPQGGFVTRSKELREVLRLVDKLRRSDLPVLITGESGTGKDHLARLVHQRSRRRHGPFLSQSCSAIPPELLEADLFGYSRGAFSGAESSHTGFLFQANGGTFLLEEIGDADWRIQGRLLRVLEEKAVRPLGAESLRPLDVRFLTSTQHDLESLIRQGRFRKDLYFRLNGSHIHIPPLRERTEDIPGLVELYSRNLPEGTVRISEEGIERLMEHAWPGNVRELITVLQRLAITHGGRKVKAADVDQVLGPAASSEVFSPSLFSHHSYETLNRALEKSYLLHLYDKHDGELDKMAEELGTTTRSIYRRFERLGLKPGQLKTKPPED